MSSLYIFYINPLSDIWFANIFSYSVHCLFILLMVSFAVQKLFSLDVIPLIFYFVAFAFAVKPKKSSPRPNKEPSVCFPQGATWTCSSLCAFSQYHSQLSVFACELSAKTRIHLVVGEHTGTSYGWGEAPENWGCLWAIWGVHKQGWPPDGVCKAVNGTHSPLCWVLNPGGYMSPHFSSLLPVSPNHLAMLIPSVFWVREKQVCLLG